MYNYYYLKEYLPKRYSADIQQEQDREIVYAFKNGELSESKIGRASCRERV